MTSSKKKSTRADISVAEKNWLAYYEQLKKFKQQHGHCIPTGDKRYAKLRLWCSTQKTSKKRHPERLSADKIKMLNKLGFEWEGRNQISSYSMAAELKRIGEKVGRTPSSTDIMDHSRYHITSYIRRFGTMDKARAKAGFPPLELYKIADEDLIKDLQRIYKKIHRMPSSFDIAEHGKYSSASYAEHFGSIPAAREKAGIGKGRIPLLNEKDLLDDLKRLQKKCHKIPSFYEIQKYGKYNYFTYMRHFGSILTAREKAGIGQIRTHKLTEEELIDELKRVSKKLNRIPSTLDLNAHGKYTSSTFIAYFGGMDKAREKAGLGKFIRRKRVSLKKRK